MTFNLFPKKQRRPQRNRNRNVLLQTTSTTRPRLEVLEDRRMLAILIDDFSTDQARLSVMSASTQGADNTIDGAGIIGGERDQQIFNFSGNTSGEVMGGSLVFSSTNGEGFYIWDGNDDDGANINRTGLGGVDLTNAGTEDSFLLRMISASQHVLTVYVYTDASTSILATPVNAISSPQDIRIPFADFGGSTDFTNVGAIAMQIDGTTDVVIDNFETFGPDINVDLTGPTSVLIRRTILRLRPDCRSAIPRPLWPQPARRCKEAIPKP